MPDKYDAAALGTMTILNEIINRLNQQGITSWPAARAALQIMAVGFLASKLADFYSAWDHYYDNFMVIQEQYFENTIRCGNCFGPGMPYYPRY